MKVEIVSIGNELLMSDILNTNEEYAARSLREVDVCLTCKVTVGDDLEMIADAFQVALRRADVVLATGGLGAGADDFTRQAAAKVTGRKLLPDAPGVSSAVLLGKAESHAPGLLIEEEQGTLICLPGNRREMAYLLETEILPYLRRRSAAQKKSGWALLRTVGVMESSLKQQLADLTLGPQQRITFDSFAGQTNIRLWVEGGTEERIDERLDQLKQIVLNRLGDHIYGEGKDRLEEVIFQTLVKNGVKLRVAECYTDRILAQTFKSVPGYHEMISLSPTTTWTGLADYLNLNELAPEGDLTRWCREAAERLLAQPDTDLGLVIYNNVTQGGVQMLVTLASPKGVSVTQRSFGGHPENINQWAATLGLTHLRRWLLAHY